MGIFKLLWNQKSSTNTSNIHLELLEFIQLNNILMFKLTLDKIILL